MLVDEAYGFIKARDESDSESISNNEDNSSGSISNLTGKQLNLLKYNFNLIHIVYLFVHNT